jgi:hypothetical protein
MRDGKSVSSSHFRLAIVQSNLGEQFQITLWIKSRFGIP